MTKVMFCNNTTYCCSKVVQGITNINIWYMLFITFEEGLLLEQTYSVNLNQSKIVNVLFLLFLDQ